MTMKQATRSALETVARDRLIRRPEVEHITSLRKSAIYDLMGRNPPEFPRAVQVTSRSVAWRESAVLDWVKERREAADKACKVRQT